MAPSAIETPDHIDITPKARRSSSHHFRRLSSLSAKKSGLTDIPTVVVPPQHVRSESNASEVAESMEMARRQMQGIAIEDDDDDEREPSTVTDKYAFAFDIDGVLIKGGDVIPEAVKAMKMLNGQNRWNIKVYGTLL